MIMVRIIHNDTPTASYWEEIIADKNGAKKMQLQKYSIWESVRTVYNFIAIDFFYPPD